MQIFYVALMWTSPTFDHAGVKFAGYELEVFPVRGLGHCTDEPVFGKSEVLIFDWAHPRKREPKDSILESFLALKTVNDVFDFANVYGALGLCAHGLPHRHFFLSANGNTGRFPFLTPDMCAPLYASYGGKVQIGESVAAWLAWVKCAQNLLKTRDELARNGLSAEVREALYQPGAPFESVFDSYPGLRRRQRNSMPPNGMLVTWTNVWLGLTGVTLRCTIRDGARTLLPCSPSCSLLGYIALQLALVLSGAKRMALCAACGAPCSPKRVATGRNSYCLKCQASGGRFKVSKRKIRLKPVSRESQSHEEQGT
jgi:hypothetical protein